MIYQNPRFGAFAKIRYFFFPKSLKIKCRLSLKVQFFANDLEDHSKMDICENPTGPQKQQFLIIPVILKILTILPIFANDFDNSDTKKSCRNHYNSTFTVSCFGSTER